MASTEARELSLVGKVELKIALAETDAALQSILSTYLAPLLLKLGSEHVQVRNKVIAVCQHVNTRVQTPYVHLPVQALLQQFKDQHNALIRHFDLLYIQKGAARLAAHERLALLHTLLPGFDENYKESRKHAAALFNLFFRLLPTLQLPPRGSQEDSSLRAKFGLNDNPSDAATFVDLVSKLLRYTATRQRNEKRPGLSVEDCDFLQMFGNEETWNPAQPGGLSLNDTKVLALKFAASGAFTDQERLFPALIASGDPAGSRTSELGDEIIKRVVPAISLEERDLVKRLFGLYLGGEGPDAIAPVRVSIQIKIVELLSRSKIASSFVNESLEVVRRGLIAGTPIEDGEKARITTQGRQMAKLANQVFAFINWLARMGSKEDKSAFAPQLIGLVRQFIEDQGWPRPRSSSVLSAAELTSRSLGYESIGLMAGAAPDDLLIEPHFELLRWLMTSLSEDPCGGETALSIEHALSSTIVAFQKPIPASLEASFASLFLHHMQVDAEVERENGVVRSTRYVAVRFVNRVLPFCNIDARFIDVLAVSTSQAERQEVRDEGQKGLHPYWNRLLNPNYEASQVTEKAQKGFGHELPDFVLLADRLLRAQDQLYLGSKPNIDAFAASLTLCRCTLLHGILRSLESEPSIDADWERNIDALIRNNERLRARIHDQLSGASAENADLARALRIFAHACFSLLATTDHANAIRGGAYAIDNFAILPQAAYSEWSLRRSRLRGAIFASNEELRKVSSHAYGLLSSLTIDTSDEISKLEETVQAKLASWNQAIGAQVYEVHGSILVEAYHLSRSIYRGTLNEQGEKRISNFTKLLIDLLSETRDKTLQDAAMLAIAELALYQFPDQCRLSLTEKSMMDILFENGKKGSEQAVITLGRLAMQASDAVDDDQSLAHALDLLHKLHEVRQPEIQFAIGEAISCAALRWDSKALVPMFDMSGEKPIKEYRTATLLQLLDRTFSDCRTTKPALRQATVIWLLCLVQFGGHLPTVQARFGQCQVAFKGFLGDRETLNQESAARGLNVVYEKGSPEIKNALVNDMVGSFTGTGHNPALKVSEETELFDEGALPTGNSSVRTYKDIMSLASEVGDSSLVYRFMALASHDAIWSSRAAFGKFGLTNILSDVSANEVLTRNTKLYAALFRYRFDPITAVRNAMDEIWKSLVKDTTQVTNEHFDEIMDDLLKNILGKEWRTRQACCAAIADLVQARPLDRYEGYLSQIWSVTFKVCDDIKETVRGAAMSLVRVLSGILVRSLEGGDASGRASDAMLKQVVPFLLGKQGLESSAQDVQVVSRKIVIDIVTKGQAKTLRPFVPELVARLLALLSSIEPEMVNYVHMNAEQFGLSKQELDDARVKHIRGSSMLEAIEKCLDYVDQDSMSELLDRLQDTILTVIGLPSKIGCSRVLATLATRQNVIFRPHADRFLQLARKQARDKNETISAAYAGACGYLARLATDGALERLLRVCQDMFFESDDDKQRVVSGDIVHAFSKYATDRFKSHATEAFPFVFVAKHDETSPHAKELFEATWNDNVGGWRAVLLYLKEIVQLIERSLDSPQWAIKHTAALAIADVVNSAGTNISIADAKAIRPALEKALTGKTWDGKEKVLQALILLLQRSPLARDDLSIQTQMQNIIMRESKRTNVIYRQHAYLCLADFIQLPATPDMFESVHGLVSPVIEDLTSSDDEMDVDSSDSKMSSKVLKESTLANAFLAVLRAVPGSTLPLEAWENRLQRCLALIKQARNAESQSRRVQGSILGALGPLFHQLAGQGTSLPRGLEETVCGYVRYIIDVGDQIEEIRLKAAESAAELALVMKKGQGGKAELADGLRSRQSVERSIAVRQVLGLALRRLETGT